MTAENGHDFDVSPSFIWQEDFRAQLEAMADTDELVEE